MAIDFPASPTVGQTLTVGSSTWQWDGTAWNIVPVMQNTAVSDAPPANPTVGQFWWRSSNGQLYIYVDDGNTKQWVQAVPGVTAANEPFQFTLANMALYSKTASAIALNNKADLSGIDIATFATGGQATFTGSITTTGSVVANQNFQSSTNTVIMGPTGAGTCYMRPNGVGSSTGQLVLGSNGDLTIIGVLYGGTGLRCRTGASGGYGTSQFNTNWTGALAVWVDTTNIGNMTVSSDYRIKKDVLDLTGMWDTVKTLRPISYTQADYGELFQASDKPQWGFLAHELQETLIEDAATGYKDAPDLIQSPNPWTVIAALTKALQEAMTRIEALEARP
jgi:hypothetical protein